MSKNGHVFDRVFDIGYLHSSKALVKPNINPDRTTHVYLSFISHLYIYMMFEDFKMSFSEHFRKFWRNFYGGKSKMTDIQMDTFTYTFYVSVYYNKNNYYFEHQNKSPNHITSRIMSHHVVRWLLLLHHGQSYFTISNNFVSVQEKEVVIEF